MAKTRRDFVKGAVSAGVAASLATSKMNAAVKAATQTRRPNILLLFPDQWRFDWMSSNAALPIKTPNLDRLAARGTTFSRAIVASPLCAPSRACLASGMEYERCHVGGNGVDYPIEQTTMYTRMRDAGYHVLAVGKMDLAKKSEYWGVDGKWRIHEWGFSDAINNAGKQDQASGYRKAGNKPVDPFMTFLTQRNLVQEHLDDYAKRHNYAATFPTPLPDDAYCDNWLGDNGLKLLNEAPKDKPWFIQVNWTGPHNPEDITARMEKTVRGRAMPPVNGEDKFDTGVNQLIRQNYTAMCENVDRGVGMYLDWLEKSGQADNTLIIFSSDHGEMLGDHGRWGKQVPYHASASVPMIVAGPGVKKAARSQALISSIDLTATILDFASVQSAKLDGRTMRPVLESRTAVHRNVVYSGLGPWRMVWDGRYKAIVNFDAGENVGEGGEGKSRPLHEAKSESLPPLVFDLETDPAEMHSIYNASGSMPEAAKALLAKLQAGGYTA